MTIKQPYYNIFLQLRDWILKEINDALNRLPKTIPCKVLINNGQTVDVEQTVNVGSPIRILSKVPIAKSKYFNIPFTSGDLGLLVPASYLYDDLVLTNLGFISDPKDSTTLSGYIFVPFTQYSQDYAGVSVNNNTKIFSQNGNADIEITNTDFKIKTNEQILWSNLKTYLDNWQINYNANINIIKAGLLALGYGAASGITNYTGTYR